MAMQISGTIMKGLSLIVLVTCLAMAWPLHASTGGSRMENLDFNNIVLLYYVPGNTVGPETYIPYVAYVDEQGAPKAWFFDAILLTALGTYQETAEWANPTFAPGADLESLDLAIAHMAEELGEPVPARRKVYLAMPVMSGTLEERIDRNRDFITITRELWNKGNYENLQLAGFYWTHEGIRDPLARQTVQWTYDYIHSLSGTEPLEKTSFELLFIPYDFGHPNRAQVLEFAEGNLPVDALWLQPNYLWADRGGGYDLQDLDEVTQFALSQGASVEMEFDPGVFLAGWKTSRYYHYLDSGFTYGYMAHPLAYYQSRWGYSEAAYNSLSVMRQLYEDTYAFSEGFYRPRSVIHEMPLPIPTSAMADLAARFTNLGDTMLGQGLWLGRGEKPDAVTHLRLIEPDPNSAHNLILTMRAPEKHVDGVPEEGVVTVRTLDGASIEIGRYPLDGQVTTQWYTVPSAVLLQGADRNPTNRLTYTIHFSEPIEIEAGWIRSQHTVMEWVRTVAEKWDAVDRMAYQSRQGDTLPGVRWDAESERVAWYGMDSNADLVLGVETNERSYVYAVDAQEIEPDGSGTFHIPDLEQGETVERVWLHHAELPYYISFGVHGDTASAVRRPGISVLPGSAWQFVGQPVGVSRRVVGRGSLQIDVPDDQRNYVLRLLVSDVVRLNWQLLPGDNSGGSPLASGSVTEDVIEIPLPSSGTFELSFTGAASFVEGWLVPGSE